MNNIFDTYPPYQLRQIFLESEWPKDFKNWVNNEIAHELLDNYLESVPDEVYKNRVKDIVENMTYGYEDENGKEMKDFEHD